MKKIFYLIPLIFLFACGNSTKNDEKYELEYFKANHKLIVSVKELKEKLSNYQAQFDELISKDFSESLCNDDIKFNCDTSNDEINVILITKYMLDNFSENNFGKYNFKMPKDSINGEPLESFNRMNFINYTDYNSPEWYSVFEKYPDLNKIPTKIKLHEYSEDFSPNYNILLNADMVNKAIDNALFGVILIKDYKKPFLDFNQRFEPGYIRGYLALTKSNTNTGKLDCLFPFVVINSTNIYYDYSGADQNSKEKQALFSNLLGEFNQYVMRLVADKTNFRPERIVVNDELFLSNYRDNSYDKDY